MKYKKLVENFSYLSLLHIFSIAIPLLTFPYLVKTLGQETYGLVIFAQAVVGYLAIFTGFGFGLSATKLVSINRHDTNKLSEIFSSVTTIKIFLLAVSIIILYVITHFLPQAKGYEDLFYLSLWFCFYDIIFPGWYFQGIENMKWITYISLLMRIIFLILIFLFIKNESDYLLVPIFNGIGALISGVFALFIIRKDKIKFIFQPMKVLRFYFFDAIIIFYSELLKNIYKSSNKIIIGVFFSMSYVALFDIGEKIVNLLKLPQVILNQVVFPKANMQNDSKFVKKIFLTSFVVNMLFLIILCLSVHTILPFFIESEIEDGVLGIILLSLTIPIVASSDILGLLVLIPNGYNKVFTSNILIAVLFYFFMVFQFWYFLDLTYLNIIIITVLTELFLFIYNYIKCKKLNLW